MIFNKRETENRIFFFFNEKITPMFIQVQNGHRKASDSTCNLSPRKFEKQKITEKKAHFSGEQSKSVAISSKSDRNLASPKSFGVDVRFVMNDPETRAENVGKNRFHVFQNDFHVFRVACSISSFGYPHRYIAFN